MNSRMRTLVILALLIGSLCLPHPLTAQPGKNQVFALAGYAGLNLSQIDGDYYFGYNLPGVKFGIETQYLAKPKYFISIGVGFAQAGARPSRSERDERGNNAVDLRINTVEIPLIFNYRLGKKREYTKKENFALYRSGTIQLGIVGSRLTSYNIGTVGAIERLPRNQRFTTVESEFNTWDLKAIVGATIQLGLKGSVYIQHNKSLRGLYNPGQVGLNDVLPLFPYSLSFGYRHTIY